MDNKLIDSLISLNIEIEGLLRVLASRDSDDATRLLVEKHSEYNILFSNFIADTTQLDSQSTADNIPEAVTSEIDMITTIADNDVVTSIVDEDIVVAPAETLAESAQQDDASASKEAAHDNGEEEHKVEEKPSIQPDAKAETTPNNDIRINDILTSKPNELRVDEMLSRREARNLRKAFTLNDKFRFRRELFANNDRLFAQTLNDIQEMTSYDQALIYVAEQLGLDLENDDVADFMLIIQNHFNAI